MTKPFLDRCIFQAVSTGTVDFVVAAAVTGFQTPAAAGAINAQVLHYAAQSTDLTQWEVGIGTYSTSGPTLTRDTVLYNSLGTLAKISFTAAPQVLISTLAIDINTVPITIGAEPVLPSLGDYWIDLSGNAYIWAAAGWDALRTTAGVTISNGGLTATLTGASAQSNTFSTVSLASGKAVFQILATDVGGGGVIGVGNINQGFSAADYLSMAGNNSIGCWTDGSVYLNDILIATIDTFTDGDTITIAVDRDASLIWFKVNAGDWNASGAADPATGTGGLDISAITGALFAGATFYATTDETTLDFSSAIVPAGFGAFPAAGWAFIETLGGGGGGGSIILGTTPIIGGTVGGVLYELTGNFVGEPPNFNIVSGDPNILNAGAYRYDGTPIMAAQIALANFYLASDSVTPGAGNTPGGSVTTATGNIALGFNALTDNITGNYNLAAGNYALYLLTSGAGNVAIGDHAAAGATTLGNCTAIGVNSMGNATGGNNNAAIGESALLSNTSGTDNLAIGSLSLSGNTVGLGNIAIGNSAQAANVSGGGNFAAGNSALAANVDGGGNLVIGNEAASTATSISFITALGGGSMKFATGGDGNVGIGQNTLFVNTTGNLNLAIGGSVLTANTTGSNNVGVGGSALIANTTGGGNVAIGSQTLKTNTVGLSNIAVGAQALQFSLDGDGNVAVGAAALQSNIHGYYNVGIGRQALQNLDASSNVGIGQFAGLSISTGSYNTIVGPCEGNYGFITTGSNNVSIGHDVAVPSATASDQLCISNFIYGIGMGGTGTTISSGKIGLGVKAPSQTLDVKTGIAFGDAAAMLHSTVAMNNGAAVALGTLANAPAAGNPTKWIPFDDNGTIRYIPAW